MNSESRSRLTVGLTLITIGILILAYRLVPDLRLIIKANFAWPLFITAFGVLLFFIGIATGAPDMAAPAVFFVGLSGILYWQNNTGNWGSWAYIWTLFPGFVGFGQILAKLLGSRESHQIEDGVKTILTSMVLFLIFGSFLGGLNILGPYWPVLIILAGVLVLIQSFVWKR